jgi:hypothetical protein
MLSERTEELLEKVSVLRAGLAMDVLRIRQMQSPPEYAAAPVRELGMRLHSIGEDLMAHADELDSPGRL